MMKTVSVMFFLSIVQQCNIGFVCTTVAGQETWAVRTSGTGNFSVQTGKNVIPVVRMDD